MQSRKIGNHFEFNRELTSKYKLIENLKDYCQLNSRYLYDITPNTFLIDI